MGQIGQSVGGTSVLRQYSFGYSDSSCKPSPLTHFEIYRRLPVKKLSIHSKVV